MRKIISFMHISLNGFVAGPKGEMDWIKVDEEIFSHVGKRISEGDTALYGPGNVSDDGKLLANRRRQAECNPA
ncbi:MAG: hypothetical protein JNJ65_01330 [Cyclobacteriaceae bacterium]|nr:hypothetical protein [Cyclobacteriaceae bacterium]